MRIKTYEAVRISDAMEAIKEQMGPDAVILETREKKRENGVRGLFSPSVFEVVAATDLSFSEEASLFKSPAAPADGAIAPSRMAPPQQSQPSDAIESPPGPFREYLKELYREPDRSPAKPVKKVPSVERNGDKMKSFGDAAEVTVLYDEVCNNGLDRETSGRLFELLKQKRGEEAPTKALLKEYIRNMIRDWTVRFVNPSPILSSEKIVAFIGPTGVGKTTTLVKIASRLCRDKKKVTLATLDTYRVGAIEQLRTYAEILGVHLRVIASTHALVALWEKKREGEFLLIDTAGRSPFHEREIKQLTMLTHVPLEAHMVLSAGTREADLLETVDHFRAIPIDRLLFTKLDETKRHGHLFGVIRKAGLPPSYFTMGQRVPEDMEEVTPDRIAEWVLPWGSERSQTRAT